MKLRRILLMAALLLFRNCLFADIIELTGPEGSVVQTFDCSVPAGVVDGDERAAVANRKNVDFVFDDFVNDAIGFDDQLVKAIVVRRYGVVALDGNRRTREGKLLKLCNVMDDLIVPADGILVGKFFFDCEEDVLEEGLRVGRELGSHFAILTVACSRRAARVLRETVSREMPLPSANSRREISMSDSNSAISLRREMGAAMVNGTRRSRAVVTMNTLMSDDAERPTSLQKDEKSRLTLSSTEIVMLAMVNLPYFACEQCVVYNKYADIAMPCLTKEAA